MLGKGEGSGGKQVTVTFIILATLCFWDFDFCWDFALTWDLRVAPVLTKVAAKTRIYTVWWPVGLRARIPTDSRTCAGLQIPTGS